MATKEETPKADVVVSPIGNLAVSTYKASNGRTVTSLHGTAADLRAWETKEFGIDDAQRQAQERRNVALAKAASDIVKEQLPQRKTDIELIFGQGNNSENFNCPLEKVVHYPEKQADGTTVKKEKVIYAPLSWQTRRVLQREVRDHHAPVQEMVAAMMAKAAVKAK